MLSIIASKAFTMWLSILLTITRRSSYDVNDACVENLDYLFKNVTHTRTREKTFSRFTLKIKNSAFIDIVKNIRKKLFSCAIFLRKFVF